MSVLMHNDGRHGRRAKLLESAAVFVIGVSLMCYVHGAAIDQSGTELGVPGYDSFYHVKMAVLLGEEGLLQEFPWLHFTYFTSEGRDFVNHHYGFHVLLSPFVQLSHSLTGDYLPGARWAMAVFFGLSLALFNGVLMACAVRWRWLYLILFVLMPFQFFTRHAYVRAISPSLVFMLLIVLLLVRRRAIALGVVIAAYIHLYLGGVVYAPVIVAVFVLSSLVGSADARRGLGRVLVAAVAGWIVGVITHPYAWGMADFLRLQVFGSGLSPDISVGREWKPYEGTWWFAQMAGVTLTAWIVALCLRLRRGQALTANELAVTLLHFVFLTLTLKARRFVEYWPVFALLSAAMLASPSINSWAVRVEEFVEARRRGFSRWLCGGLAGLSVLLIVAVVLWTPPWREVRNVVKCKYDLPAVREAMAFIAAESEAGDVIFTDDWDVFPVYFYFNHHNHYVVGLDPKFTHARDPVLWERFVRITRGQVPIMTSVKTTPPAGEPRSEQVAIALTDIRDAFGAAFVIADRDHKALSARLSKQADLATLVYPSTSIAEAGDAPYLVFRIHPAQKP